MSDDLYKNWKGALAGIGLAAGVIPPPANAGEHNRRLEQAFDSAQYDEAHTPPEMHGIAQNESSGGKNMNHAKSPKGEMDTAYGALGFKPQTAFEVYSKTPHLKKLFGEHDQNSFLQEFKRNPNFYNALAGVHWNDNKKKTGSVEGAAFAWRRGLGAALKAKPEEIAADPYVVNYLKHHKR